MLICIYMLQSCQGENYTIGQNDVDDLFFFEFLADTQEDRHSLSYKEVVS